MLSFWTLTCVSTARGPGVSQKKKKAAAKCLDTRPAVEKDFQKKVPQPVCRILYEDGWRGTPFAFVLKHVL